MAIFTDLREMQLDSFWVQIYENFGEFWRLSNTGKRVGIVYLIDDQYPTVNYIPQRAQTGVEHPWCPYSVVYLSNL